MKPEDPQPLWRDLVGDTEPWRRGRIILAAIVSLDLIGRGIVLAAWILAGDIEVILTLIAISVIVLVLFYFIWIGVHWVRFLTAAWIGFVGLGYVIWGLHDNVGVEFIVGGANLFCAGYLAISPSVYFFAKHQRESSWWKESVAFAVICVLLLSSVGSAMFAIQRYREQQLVEAQTFADLVFRKAHIETDEQFLLSHATARLMQRKGYAILKAFLANNTRRVGVVRNLRPSHGTIKFRFIFPMRAAAEGYMYAEADAKEGHIELQARIVLLEGEWQIDAMTWNYIQPAH